MLKNKLDSYSAAYSTTNLAVDDMLIEAAYHEFERYFEGTSCLELGPANGIMTEYLQSSFEFLDLVEGAESLLRQIPDYPNVTKYNSLFSDFDPDKQYDTIIMNHVLEHLESPVKELKHISKWLKNDGVFICGVPNANSFHRLIAVELGILKSCTELNARDHSLGHFRVYTSNELKKDVEAAGFKIVSSGGIGLKFLSNAQLKEHFSDDFIRASLKMGSVTPNHGAEVYVICRKTSN